MSSDPRRYSHDRYNHLLEVTFDQARQLSTLKGGEYAGDDDRLENFRRNAATLYVNMETVWAVYAAKHWDALMQYIKDLQVGKTRPRLESLSSRCDDLIVYLLLFKAMLDEKAPRDNPPETGTWVGTPGRPVGPGEILYK